MKRFVKRNMGTFVITSNICSQKTWIFGNTKVNLVGGEMPAQ